MRDVDGDIHWVHSKLVTSKYRCATVKVNSANLRKGPGQRYPTSDLYPKGLKYDSFKVIKIRKRWAQIEDFDGDRYWVFRNLIWIY